MGRHVHAERAIQWFNDSSAESFLFSRVTQLGLLRLLTTAAILGEDALSMSGAWLLMDKLLSDPHIALLPRTKSS